MNRVMQFGVVMMALSGYGAGVAQAPTAPPVAAQKTEAATADAGAKLTDKQKALAAQADRLVALANELQVQVDSTSKNILSLKVVQKAEEIESFARQMKGSTQAKK